MADSPAGQLAELCEKGMLLCGVIWGACWVLKKIGQKAAEHAVPLILIGVVVASIVIAMRIRKASQEKQAEQRDQAEDDERNEQFPNG